MPRILGPLRRPVHVVSRASEKQLIAAAAIAGKNQ
jgi:hypothetical protein